MDFTTRKRLIELKQLIIEVSNHLIKGLREDVYRNAITCELRERQINFTFEETISVFYKGKCVGLQRMDICLTSWLEAIIELKAVSGDIKPEHCWQLLSYMIQKNYSLGLVVNFTSSPSKECCFRMIVKKEDDDDNFYFYDCDTDEFTLVEGYSFQATSRRSH